VAAFASWHEGHRASVAALDRKPRVPAHVLIETYSVLTRLPPPHRAEADLVVAFLAQRFRDSPLTLPARAHVALLQTASESGLAGGAIYDAIVAATARHAGATLLTRDHRARPVYERIGVRHQMVG